MLALVVLASLPPDPPVELGGDIPVVIEKGGVVRVGDAGPTVSPGKTHDVDAIVIRRDADTPDVMVLPWSKDPVVFADGQPARVDRSGRKTMLVYDPKGGDETPREPPAGSVTHVHERVLEIPVELRDCRFGDLIHEHTVVPPGRWRIDRSDRTIVGEAVPTRIDDPECTGDEAPAKIFADDGQTVIVGFDTGETVAPKRIHDGADTLVENGRLIVLVWDTSLMWGTSGESHAPSFFYRVPHTTLPIRLRIEP